MMGVEIRASGGSNALEQARPPVAGVADGQMLIRVLAAGVRPWDAWVPVWRSSVPQPLPLLPGSDLSDAIQATGWIISARMPGDVG